MAVNLPLTLGNSPTSGSSATLRTQDILPTGASTGPNTSNSNPYGPGYDSVGNLINPAAAGLGGSGGATGGSGGSGAAPLPSGQSSFNPQTYATQQQGNAQSELDARNAQIRSGISSAYQPIFDAFDSQIGMLPQQQDTANKQVGDLATGQKSDITSQQNQQVGDLKSNIDDEYNTTDTNLAQLNNNVANMLKAGQFYLGALGAGDSGATNDYLANVTNNTNKTAGQMFQQRDMAVHQINQKISDVNSLAGQNLNDVDTWKNNQLSTITQEFQKQLSDLQMGKANAQGQEGKDLVNLQQSALDNYYSRLKQLDDTVYGYNSAIAQWQTERAGWLSDQLTLMKNNGSYSSNTNPQQQALIQSLLQGSGGNTGQTSTSGAAPGSGATATATPTSNPLQDLIGGIGNVLGSGANTVKNIFSGL